MTDGGATDFRHALFARTPRVWVTYVLVAVNVAVFLTMIGFGVDVMSPTSDSLIASGANFGPRTTGGQWWRLLTSVFVHVGMVHIAMNMLGLWQMGPFIERLLGNRPFLIVYLLAGLAGSVASVAWNPSVLSAGASGAIFGLYGALGAFVVRNRRVIPGPVLSGLLRGSLVFIGLNVFLGLRIKGIDMAAHAGGLVGGFIAALPVARVDLRAAAQTRGRDAILAVAGLAAIVAASALLPRAVDPKAEYQLRSEGNRILHAYTDATNKFWSHEISGREWADVIDHDVLPSWRHLQERWAHLEGAAAAHRAQVDDMGRFLALCEKAWSLRSEALRTHDMGKAGQSDALQEQADELLRKLNGKRSNAGKNDVQ